MFVQQSNEEFTGRAIVDGQRQSLLYLVVSVTWRRLMIQRKSSPSGSIADLTHLLRLHLTASHRRLPVLPRLGLIVEDSHIFASI
jgi:hypothetical protein